MLVLTWRRGRHSSAASAPGAAGGYAGSGCSIRLAGGVVSVALVLLAPPLAVTAAAVARTPCATTPLFAVSDIVVVARARARSPRPPCGRRRGSRREPTCWPARRRSGHRPPGARRSPASAGRAWSAISLAGSPSSAGGAGALRARERRRPPRGEAGLVWIDAEGYRVGAERRGTTSPLPILTGPVEPPPAHPDHTVGDRLQRRPDASASRAPAPPAGPAARISEIDVERVGQGRCSTWSTGRRCGWGASAGTSGSGRLEGVLGELEERGERAESVDLRFRDLVVLTPHSPAPPGGPARSPAAAARRRAVGDPATLAMPAAAGLERR